MQLLWQLPSRVCQPSGLLRDIPTWAKSLDPSSLQLLPHFTAYHSSPWTLCDYSLFMAKLLMTPVEDSKENLTQGRVVEVGALGGRG